MNEKYGLRKAILVIDDSPVIREMLNEILTDDGFKVDIADNGEKGAALAMKNDYDVVICDVHMPRMNGLETVRKILTSKPSTKIIMTDSLPDKMARSAKSEGALCCLQKPFDVKELRDILSRVIVKERVTFGGK